MGTQRNGARTVLDLLAKCCRLSRLPGFRTGIGGILGDEAAGFFAAFDALCAVVDALIAADNFYNRIDFTQETPLSEDIPLA